MKKGFILIKKICGSFIKLLSFVLGVAIVGALLGANHFAPRYSALISNFLGHTSSKIVSNGGKEADKKYFTSDFASDDDWKKSGDALVREVEQEGIVLLKNNAKNLPLPADIKITLLGQNSVDFIYGGGGSGSVNAKGLPTLKDSLESSGFKVNGTAWDFYTKGPGKDYRKEVTSVTGQGEFAVNEVPQSAYTDEVLKSFDDYQDVGIVVIGRSGGESADLPIKPLKTGVHYLELDNNEKDLLKLAKERFDKVVVILNTVNAMELDFLDAEGVDAALWVGAVGQSGILAIGDILSGEVNPSGRLVDTYAYDVFSAPAMANLGDYTFTNSKIKNGDKFMVYSEGIYVGYRYYETRYEDVVLGRDQSGQYDYKEAVQYPFGYGLSYTDFTYGDVKLTEKNNQFELSVKVTNSGDVAGKEVVQVYLQSPYTDYNQQNNIEKSAIELVGFEKTKKLAVGESETVTVRIPKESLKVYDSQGYKTYIVDAGNYHFTVGKNAHDALNNILAKKGKSITDGMTHNGQENLVATYQQTELDAKTYSVSQETGETITNAFNDVDIRAYDEKATYLSRRDWTGSWPATYREGAWQIDDEMLKELDLIVAEDDKSVQMPVTGTVDKEIGKLDILDLKGLDFNDPLWSTLLDQLTVEEMDKLVRNGGYATIPLESINLPSTIIKDGPAGISSTLVGGKSGTAYPVQVVMGSTWNTDLMEQVGVSVGNDTLHVDVNGWYAPGANLHRVAFGGRNFEYFSEDSFLSGAMSASEIKGVQSKGTFVTIKHYALNDTETNRIGGSMFANEQTVRDLYLKPFEIAIRESDATGVMTAMNRLGTTWAGADKGLMTTTLKNEWGFKGIVSTDQASFDNFAYADLREGLAAGTNLWLNTNANLWKLEESEYTPAVVKQLRESSHAILYTIVNSNAMNGLGEGDSVKEVLPLWRYWLMAATAILGLLAIVLIYFPIRSVCRLISKLFRKKK
ncbi:glycoside hydrolase family 3 N-terminal domain-containing protein [Streptococcus sp. S784/96/1]|uniref:glycoside hydrolase family 3 N-terminal domain-containing protein n=1 Tax=Streptococcus sp. S784/96/1 TaxID=2653499 RepID=UPI001386B872|nr:glycoside hydrolase family 3 N-terminal domain-containing protein [Streptococcus sp. S784/96/1]